MPLAALMAAKIFGLNPQLAAGLVLVGTCPGGTASNVMTYLAGGAVALSITLTAVSTLLSVVATPTITWLLVDQSVPVPVLSMLRTIFVIVIVPVTVGVVVNQRWGDAIERIKRFSPVLSVSAIVLIIAIVVAGNRNELMHIGPGVLAAVGLHNGLGLGVGYGLSKLLRFTEAEARTLAIEVGMQNSGLGVVLSHRYFSALAALPGAVFSIWHNLTGSILASLWSNRLSDGRNT
jgi:BASS family bile acid:Na+ symporter